MAGEAIRDANFDARSRLSSDPEEAARRAALVGDKYDVSGFSDKEISMALMGASFGDEDYARLTGKSLDKEEDKDDSSKDKPKAGGGDTISDSFNTDIRDSFNKTNTDSFNTDIRDSFNRNEVFESKTTQTQNIAQDNDITNTINGDNNVISNNQNNSISQSLGSSDYATRYARGLKDKYVLNLLNR